MNNLPANITPFPVPGSLFPDTGNKHWKLDYANVRIPISKTPSDRRGAQNTFACRRRRSGCPTSEARNFCGAKVARGRATDIANRCF